MFRYEIKALYVPTNKKRTIKIEAQNKADAIAFIKRDSEYAEPFEIKEFFDPPTESQLDYAKDLKIKMPRDASIRDASALISRAVDRDSDPNLDLIEYAKGRGLLFSKYAGKKTLYNLIFLNLPQLDKIAFFAFSVYRWLSEDRHGNLDTHPQRHFFYDYARLKSGDEKFIKSMEKYQGEDIRFFGMIKFSDGGEAYGGSISTIAYKDCTDYLNKKLGLQKSKILKVANDTSKAIKTNASADKPGSKVAIIVIVIIAIVIIWLMII